MLLCETISLNKMEKIKFYSSETGSKKIRSCNIQQDKREAQTIYNFISWFAGFTDGDGCFNIYIYPKEDKITFTFKISLTQTNKRALISMKKHLKHGNISKVDSNQMVHYRITRIKDLNHTILPLFDTIPLQTEKLICYLMFKQCLMIYQDSTKTLEQRIKEIIYLRKNPPLVMLNNKSKRVYNKWWLVGFIEAEGSFYLTKKAKDRIVHGFGITQKLDKHVLDQVRYELGLKPVVRWNKSGFWSLDATGINDIKRIKVYFFNSFKGITSLYYRIWARSLKHKGKYQKLLSVQGKIRQWKK